MHEPPTTADDRPGQGASDAIALSPASSQSNPHVPSVIVVEHSPKGHLSRLSPPLAILLVALVVSSYQRKTLIPISAYRAAVVRPAEPASNREVVAPAETTPPKDPSPPILAAVPPATPAVDEPVRVAAPADVPVAAAAKPSPFEFDPSDGLIPVTAGVDPGVTHAAEPVPRATAEPSPPVAANVPTASPFDDLPATEEDGARDPAPEMGRDDILGDIQREAANKEAQIKDLQDLKPRAQAMIFAEALNRVNASRVAFRSEIKKTLKSEGDDVGREIERLCQQYGREPLPEVKKYYLRSLRSFPPRTSTAAQIEFLRRCGMPEPALLDFLAHKEHRKINTRGGPRDENEVRARAAKLLLSFPVTPAKPGESAGAAK